MLDPVAEEVFFELCEFVRVTAREEAWSSAGGWEARKLDALGGLPEQAARQDPEPSGKKNKGDIEILPKTASKAFPK